MDIRNQIQIAMAKDLMYLHYQPQVDREGKVIGVEALCRIDGMHGAINPLQFIKVAENSGQIIDLGEKVIDIACKQLRDWLDNGVVDSTFSMSINVSGEQLDDKNFNSRVCKVLTHYDLNPAQIMLELTESTLISDVHVAKLHLFARNGVKISIDDFGTGYSSLARLKFLPINEIKIDKVFVDDITKTDEDVALMTAIFQLARALNLHTVVEGVEKHAQLEILLDIGFKVFQGYYYSKPLSAVDAADFIILANA